MMRPSVQGVDPPVCCTPGCYCYICKRQLCGFTGWALCLLEGGVQISWMLLLHMQETVFVDSPADILAPVLHNPPGPHCHNSSERVSNPGFRRGRRAL